MCRWIRSLSARTARAARWVVAVLAVLLMAGTWHHGEYCFAAGTPLLTPNGGAKPIEQFVAGDLILSRDQWDVEGPVEPKVVEEVFVRFGGVLCLSAGGQTIKTTHAHPFWVVGKGWLPAKEIQVGDWLLGHDGQRTQVDAIEEGEWETLYNLRVADHHTYFVGCSEWGFSLWAHNEYPGTRVNEMLDDLVGFKVKNTQADKIGRAVTAGEQKPLEGLLEKAGVDPTDTARVAGELFKDAGVTPKVAIPGAATPKEIPAHIPRPEHLPSDFAADPIKNKVVYEVNGQKPVEIDLRKADWKADIPASAIGKDGLYILRNPLTQQRFKVGKVEHMDVSGGRLQQYADQMVGEYGVPVVVDYYPIEARYTAQKPLRRLEAELRYEVKDVDKWSLPVDHENIKRVPPTPEIPHTLRITRS